MKWILLTILSLAVLLFLYFFYSSQKYRKQRKKQTKLFHEIFECRQITMPTIKFGFAYAWPTFKITFQNESDLRTAKQLGRCKKFEDEIENMYGPPFESKYAITYVFLEK